ncbi:3-keto-5-aminohexanoate cleavage protein [Myxococcota bacterium]|nr:3-keto-5-aminohexanoate cleavage protein [Myxococcota bacterium]
MEPLIIECALNEQVTKDQNETVPISPQEIVDETLAAAAAGAAIVHFHARDPESGDLLHPGTEFYREVMRAIRRENADVMLYPTYGASPTPEERFSHLMALAEDPDVRLDFATIDPGAVNYADFDPENASLGWDFVLSVSHGESRFFFELCEAHGIQFSFTVRELGHVRHALAYRRMGWCSGPMLFKVTMSENHAWGISPSPEGLRILTRAVISPEVPYRWMTYVEGACHADMCRFAVTQGGHVRTGVGDNPMFEGAPLSNAEQVTRVVAMAREAGRNVADPRQARALLARNPEP